MSDPQLEELAEAAARLAAGADEAVAALRKISKALTALQREINRLGAVEESKVKPPDDGQSDWWHEPHYPLEEVR